MKIEMTGKRFGLLVVVEEAGRSKGGHVLFKCICDCGNIKVVRGSSLQDGSTKSCGCLLTNLFNIEMTGQKFGRLTVIRKVGQDKHKSILWECKCDCGNIKIITGNHLRTGHTKSCGCWKQEVITKHGMYETPMYKVWTSMLQRCNNSKNPAFHHYGGRGIIVCKGWLNFEKFYKDMGERPRGLTIERIDNDKGYSKENCEWKSWTDQSRNQRISQNNTTGIKGVSWSKVSQKYRAYITVNYKQLHIGLYDTIEAAGMARIEAEQKYW